MQERDTTVDYHTKATNLVKLAETIAAGSMVKGRVKENLQTLNEMKGSIAQQKEQAKIAADLRIVTDALQRFRNRYSYSQHDPQKLPQRFRKYKTISDADNLARTCKPCLDRMKNILGSHNDLYLQISSAVVNNCIGACVEVINASQTSMDIISGTLTLQVSSALALMSYLSSFDMNSSERKHYNNNKSSLDNLYTQVTAISGRVSDSKSSYKSSSSDSNTNWGCWIAAIVGFIVFISIIELSNFK
jgi:hypothetical protein